MSAPKHTKGPQHAPGQWYFEQRKEWPFPIQIFSKKRRTPIAEMTSWVGLKTGGREANAARIVACVNACEGIEDPSVVPEILRLLGEMLRSESIEGRADDLGTLYALLARAEGGRK